MSTPTPKQAIETIINGPQAAQARALQRAHRDRPGELNRYTCGCWIERDSSGQHHLHYCQLHAQAPRLVEAVKSLINNNGTGAMEWAVNNAKQVLAQIEKGA